jgi:hypothetical protein
MEVNFELKNIREPLGKKPPFIGQENCTLQSFRRAPEKIPEWLQTVLRSEYNTTIQPGAEPGATLDFTPDLQSSKNTHTKNVTTFASELRLANLGFLKS